MSDYMSKINDHYDELTKGMKLVADFLMRDPTAFATHPAKKVGEFIDVSETMVLRFCTAIGYTGFSQLQTEVREYIFDLGAKKTITSDEPLPHYKEVMLSDLANIQETANRFTEEDFEQTIEKIDEADEILVAGLHASFSMAHWLSYTLNLVRGGASLYRPESDVGLNRFTEKSVVIVFSFYRYAMDTITLAKEAKERGIHIIAFTDSLTAPITKIADQLFVLNLPAKSILQTVPVVYSILNAILAGVALKQTQPGETRKNMFIQEDSRKFCVK
ncbi:MurR/RpiR family transcriptional regulator [Falsibacillus albus]|uniref:MurR/RpiR family transcriptional regulator n=1 Tax=Falsibacillus albus TaxID=2478915 RepID=A0A3L7JUM8_9BACI|nr:MurR/RpiR family transcriptional regulator [Falsibacillus albus]RLQ94597.1 MurR/RpiR family transcriptional regulator [Falsibacillus albus]